MFSPSSIPAAAAAAARELRAPSKHGDQLPQDPRQPLWHERDEGEEPEAIDWILMEERRRDSGDIVCIKSSPSLPRSCRSLDVCFATTRRALLLERTGTKRRKIDAAQSGENTRLRKVSSIERRKKTKKKKLNLFLFLFIIIIIILFTGRHARPRRRGQDHDPLQAAHRRGVVHGADHR